MLDLLRKNTKTILWVVIILFVLWGGFSVGTQFQKQGRMAGKVFNRDVSFQEFNNFYRANQILTFSGQPIEDSEFLKQQTWQSIIFAREAKNKKIQVTDDEVRQEIMRLLASRKIDNPTPEFYKQWLMSSVNEKPHEFESKLREFLRIQKLIKQVHDQPIEIPSEEKLHERFVREQNKIGISIVKFPKEDEAKAFMEKVKNPKKWDDEIKPYSKQADTSELLGLDAIMNRYGLSFDLAKQLHQMEKNQISGPHAVGNEFAIIRLNDKQNADDEKFQKELKDQYLKDEEERQRLMRFMSWTREINERAKLEDYLPSSQTSSAPPVTQ